MGRARLLQKLYSGRPSVYTRCSPTIIDVPNLMWIKKPTFSSYVQDFPVRETELVQISAGELGLKTEQCWGKDVCITRVACMAQSVWRMLVSPEWIGLALPLSWADSYKLNGWDAQPRDVIFIDGRYEFTTTAANRKAVLLGIRRETIAKACGDLSGRDTFDLGDGHRLYSVSTAHHRDLLVALDQCYLAAETSGRVNNKLLLQPAHEADLLLDVAQWLLSNAFEVTESKFNNLSDFEIVSRAKEAARKQDIGQVTMATLCAEAGVGKSTLHKAFLETHGISPMQFVQRSRLTAVRELLLDPGLPVQSVKEAALTCGFTSFGRFSAQYFKLFGEYPSQTLSQNEAVGQK